MAARGQGAEGRTGHAPIEDHGVIGDLHTAALVSTEGDIEWLCLPRFDSPSVFAALLDDERGGRFSVRCAGATRTKQMYLPDSNILVTRFLGESSVGEVVDFMVPRERNGRGTLQLVRIVRAVRGAGARPDPLRTGLRLRPGPHGGRHRRGGRGVLLLAGGPAGAEVDGAAAGRRRRPPSPTPFSRRGSCWRCPCRGRARRGPWTWSRSTTCSRAPWRTGSTGSGSRGTAAATGRWSNVRPSR